MRELALISSSVVDFADLRESRSGLTQQLERLGAQVVSEELECGDYVLADGFGIERKAATDFVVFILDRRLFS